MSLRDLGLPSLLPLWVAGAFVAVHVFRLKPEHLTIGSDARAYWLTAHGSNWYGIPPNHPDAYLYSPVFAQLVRPLTILPWLPFILVWMLLETAAFAWLFAPLGWRWSVPLVLLCSVEIRLGNIHAFLAVVAAIGLRRPTAWALPILTKVSLGLGPVWFAARREWRPLAWSVGSTLLIAGGSFAIAPQAWSAWVRFLVANGGEDALLRYRIAAGIAVTIYAARANKPWLLALAMVLASPVVHSVVPITLLAAIPRLRAPHALVVEERTPPRRNAAGPFAPDGKPAMAAWLRRSSFE